ncbi:tRNA-modifying protein YgfZ [Thalassotalea fusca]
MLVDQLPKHDNLADAYAIPLTHFDIITLAGEENIKYLQGQVTCDVASLADKHLLNGAHCNAKGKVHSTFRLFEKNNALCLVQSSAATEASFAELKKFGVFSKVNIELAKSYVLYGFGGNAIEQVLSKHFARLPDALTPVVHDEDTSILYLPGHSSRYIVVSTNSQELSVLNEDSLTQYPADVWRLLEILNGIPALQTSSIGEYVPQMLNVQAINGISFTKGCYLGQETVARMQYLGKNKRALFCLKGQSDEQLSSISAVEKQLGENWRKAGDIICHYQSASGDLYVQAVLANDIDSTTALRVKEHESASLSIVDLPYSISTQE